MAAELTSRRAADPSRVQALLRQVQRPIASVRADGGYDVSGVYEAIDNHRPERSPRVLIPPRKGAQRAAVSPMTRERNRNIAGRARVAHAVGLQQAEQSGDDLLRRCPPPVQFVLGIGLLYAAIVFAPRSAPTFIYFQF